MRTNQNPTARAPWLVVIACVVGALASSACADKESAADGEGAGKAPKPALVEVALVRDGSLSKERAYFAEVEPVLEASLAAGAAGEVRAVQVRVGERVERGQTLVTIDANLADAQLEQAVAARATVEEQRAQILRDVERIEKLGPEVRPQVEAERLSSQARALEAQLASLDASIGQARETLRRHRVRAPFDGVVARRLANPGDWVSPGTPVLELVDAGRVEVLVNAGPELLDNVKVGGEARLRRGEHEVGARIEGVVGALEARTRTARLRLTPVGEAPWLLPGQVVDAVFDFEYAVEDALVVPRDAVTPSGAGDRVIVEREGKARAFDVQILERAATEVLVRAEGLEAGDRAVVRGNERLRPGQPLTVRTPASESTVQ